MHQFFINQELVINNEVSFSKENTFQMLTVLKLRSGEKVLVCDQNKMFEAELIITDKNVKARCLTEIKIDPVKIEVTLIQSLIRKEKFELVLQKATELGVSRIVPLILDRNVVKWEKEPEKMNRYRHILLEASEQCHRLTIPELCEPITLKNIEDYKSEQNFVAYEIEDKKHQLKNVLTPTKTITLVIGPEGGISPKEIIQLTSFGFESVSLGSRIYRSETAAMVAIHTIDCVFDI